MQWYHPRWTPKRTTYHLVSHNPLFCHFINRTASIWQLNWMLINLLVCGGDKQSSWSRFLMYDTRDRVDGSKRVKSERDVTLFRRTASAANCESANEAKSRAYCPLTPSIRSAVYPYLTKCIEQLCLPDYSTCAVSSCSVVGRFVSCELRAGTALVSVKVSISGTNFYESDGKFLLS